MGEVLTADRFAIRRIATGELCLRPREYAGRQRFSCRGSVSWRRHDLAKRDSPVRCIQQGEGKLHIRLGNIIAGATYTVYTGKSPYGPWTAVASGVEKSEFEIDAPEEGTEMLFIKAEMTMEE